MEFIEEGLRGIETNFENTKSKQYKILLDSINKTSKKVYNNCSKFDRTIKKTFPQCPEPPEKIEVFNPNRVICFDENLKANKTMDEWDTTIGILPNRYVKYTINNYRYNNDYDLEFKKKINERDITFYDNINTNEFDYTCFNCKTNTNVHNCATHGKHRKGFVINTDIFINNQTKSIIQHTTNNTKLVIDNYLNIYVPDEKIYLLFNKTPFPEFAFHSNHKLSHIYFDMNLNVDSKVYMSKDEENIKLTLTMCDNLIPDNYKEVYDYFNNTRKLFTILNMDNNINNVDNINKDEEIPEMNLKEHIINGYKDKLNLSLKENKLIKEKIIELEELFIDKSNTVIKLERDLKYQQQDFLEKCEKMEQDKFNFKTMELNTELLASKFSILMETDEKTKLKLKNYELKYNSIKDINNGLIEKYKLIKTNLNEVNTINTKYENEILYHEEKIITLQNEINENNNVIEKINNQNLILESRLTNIGELSTDSLEQALTEQNNELIEQIKDYKEKINELNKENNKLNTNINNYKITLTGLFESTI